MRRYSHLKWPDYSKMLLDSFLTPIAISRARGMYPRFLLLNVTSRCNSRCMMCTVWKRETTDDLSKDEFIKLFKENSEFFEHLGDLSVSGGEPYLNPDLPEILCTIGDTCRNLKNITIPTNGLSTKLIVKRTEEIMRCIDKNITINVGVSIDGIGKVHDDIRGIEGAYSKAVETLKGLKQLSLSYSNLKTGFGTVIIPANIDGLESLEKLSKELDVNYSFTPCVYTENLYGNIEDSALRFKGKQLQKLIEFLRERSDSSGNGFKNYCAAEILSSRSIPLQCPWGYSFMYIDSNGDVYPCHYLPEEYIFGNIKSMPIKKIWFSHKSDEIRKRLKTEYYCNYCIRNCGFYENMKTNVWAYLFYKIRRPLIQSIKKEA